MGNKTPYIFLTYIWGKISNMGNFTPWFFWSPHGVLVGFFMGLFFPHFSPWDLYFWHQISQKLAKNIWLASWEKGPYLPTSQLSENDVKVRELETSKSRQCQPGSIFVGCLYYCTLFSPSIKTINWPVNISERESLWIFRWKFNSYLY